MPRGDLIVPPPLQTPKCTSHTVVTTSLLHAAVRSHGPKALDSVRHLLAEDQSALHLVDEKGYTPLMVAAALDDKAQSLAITKLLLDADRDRGSEPSPLLAASDHDGFTALHWAVACASDDTLRVLIERGAAVNQASNCGDTALHRATRFGRENIIRVLLESGADYRLENKERRTCFEVAGMLPGPNQRVAFNRSLAVKVQETLLQLVPALRVLLLTHSDCKQHFSHKNFHQEVPQRLTAIVGTLRADLPAKGVAWSTAFPPATFEDVLRAHDRAYVKMVWDLASEVQRKGVHAVPFTPHVQRVLASKRHPSSQIPKRLAKTPEQCDTSFSQGSMEAALRAAGAVKFAIDAVMKGERRNAFCAVRPPGHHAGPCGLVGSGSCGFCIFNSVAIGALHALEVYGARRDARPGRPLTPRVDRVAIVDFDVHHGNGTEAIIKAQPRYADRLMFCSIHLMYAEGKFKFYPGTGKKDFLKDNVMNVALTPLWSGGTGRVDFKQQLAARLVFALRAFNPDLILLSAGFDGAKNDIGNQKLNDCHRVLQGMDLTPRDYKWLTETIINVASICCRGRVVSVLEGGYGRHIRKHRPKARQSPSKRKRSSPCTCEADAKPAARRRSRSLPDLGDVAVTRQHTVRFYARGIVGRRLPFTPSPQSSKGRPKPFWDDSAHAAAAAAEGAGSERAAVEAVTAEASEASADPPRADDRPETSALSLDRSYLANCCLAHVQALIGRSR